MALEEVWVKTFPDVPRHEEFESWALHMEHLYSINLGKLRAGPVRRLILRATVSTELVGSTGYDVEEYQFPFPFSVFWRAKNLDRRRLMVDWIGEKLRRIAKLRKWDSKPFREAHQRVLETNLINEGTSEKATLSPDQVWTACWHYAYESDQLTFNILVAPAAGGPSKLYPVLVGPPYAAMLKQNLGKVIWKNKTTVALVSRDGKKSWKAKVSPKDFLGLVEGSPSRASAAALKKPAGTAPPKTPASKKRTPTQQKKAVKKAGAVVKNSPTSRMRENVFWSLIARLDWKQTGDDEAVVEPLVAALASLSVAEIKGFDDCLAQKLHALDGEKYARQIGMDAYVDNSYFSPDLFLYARACTVANGRKVYESALANPRKMIKDKEFEMLLYVPQNAYERRTGKEYKHIATPNYETWANSSGWE